MIQITEEEYDQFEEQAMIYDAESGRDREFDYDGTEETTDRLLDEKFGEGNWELNF